MNKLLIGMAVGLVAGAAVYKKSSEIKSLVNKGKKKLESLKD